jgi:hypothetical protein
MEKLVKVQVADSTTSHLVFVLYFPPKYSKQWLCLFILKEKTLDTNSIISVAMMIAHDIVMQKGGVGYLSVYVVRVALQ